MADWMPWVTSGVVGCLADARTCASDMLRRTASLVDGEIGWRGEMRRTCLCRRRRRRGGGRETLPFMEAKESEEGGWWESTARKGKGGVVDCSIKVGH